MAEIVNLIATVSNCNGYRGDEGEVSTQSRGEKSLPIGER
jgi:hypothetical protein